MAKKEASNASSLILLVILLVFLAVIDLSSLYIWKISSPSSSPSNSTSQSTQKVSQIISGDTIKMSDGSIVKLIGIKAPEIGMAYSEQSANMLNFLLLNKQVSLESDVSDKDSSGNLLRYVYVDYNGQSVFVNAESVRQGLSIPFSDSVNVKHKAEIDAARADCLRTRLNLCS